MQIQSDARILALLSKALEERGFKRVRIANPQYSGALGTLWTNVFVGGSLDENADTLLVTCGVHGPEGVTTQLALLELLRGDFRVPAGMRMIIAPDVCPDNWINAGGVHFRMRDIPVYDADGNMIPGVRVDPNRACALPSDSDFWDMMEQNTHWLRPLWDMLIPDYAAPPEATIERWSQLREAVCDQLDPKQHAGWQQILFRRIVAGQTHAPHGLFHSHPESYTFLRDIFVPQIALMLTWSKRVRMLDLHTGLPTMAFLVGGDEIAKRTITSLNLTPVSSGEGRPPVCDLFGHQAMVITDFGAGSLLAGLISRLHPQSIECALGLEFSMAPGTAPWLPVPTTVDELAHRRTTGASEVDNMIETYYWMLGMHSGEHRESVIEGLIGSARRSHAYFSFSNAPDHQEVYTKLVREALDHAIAGLNG